MLLSLRDLHSQMQQLEEKHTKLISNMVSISKLETYEHAFENQPDEEKEVAPIEPSPE